ncbi:MAG: hypothetical protein FJX48_10005 [Alphaproteobacteria bacterium]|nr:hypothetical protein [Alphaproteobacteria bacterium]
MARWRERANLDSGLKLDINKLLRDGTLQPGELTSQVTYWRRVANGEIVAIAIIEAEMRSDRPPRISIEHDGREQGVRLTYRPRNFGGVQWYFLCPDTGRRVSVLWKPPGACYFASREAFGRQVAYGSQFQTPRDRAISAAQSIRRRLGGNEWLSGLNGFPPRRCPDRC